MLSDVIMPRRPGMMRVVFRLIIAQDAPCSAGERFKNIFSLDTMFIMKITAKESDTNDILQTFR